MASTRKRDDRARRKVRERLDAVVRAALGNVLPRHQDDFDLVDIIRGWICVGVRNGGFIYWGDDGLICGMNSAHDIHVRENEEGDLVADVRYWTDEPVPRRFTRHYCNRELRAMLG